MPRRPPSGRDHLSPLKTMDAQPPGFPPAIQGDTQPVLDDEQARDPRGPSLKRARKAEKKHALETGTWSRCMHFIAKKQRHCNIHRAKGSTFCSHHDAATASLRTPCPVDPSHSVWMNVLESHVPKCATAMQHKERLALPYFKERYNCGGALAGELEAIGKVYSLLGGSEERKEAEAEDEEKEEEEVEKEGGAKGGEAHKGAREGTLTALFKHQGTLGFSIPSLCQRLVHWASTPEHAPITNPHGQFFVHESAMPCLRSTLANMRTDGEGGAGEEAAAAKVVASKAATFRHELQQASIVTNTLLAVRGVKEGGGGGGDTKQAFGARLFESSTLPLGESDASPLFVEFGAGRGMLSFTLDNMLPTPCRMLLLERASVGGKKVDKELRQEAKASSSSSSASLPISTVHRIRLDIQDCALREALNHFSPQGGGVVAIGKHLCGAATDLTLRCLAESVGSLGGSMEAVRVAAGDVAAAEKAPSPSLAPPLSSAAAAGCGPVHALKAISIALCCHHACAWSEYVGKTWWREVFKGSAVDFEVCRYLSSWALLEEGRGEALQGFASPPTLPPLTLSPEWVTSLSVASKAWIGRAAKRAIDAGRLNFMSLALKCGGELIEYCPPRVSLENILLLHSA